MRKWLWIPLIILIALVPRLVLADAPLEDTGVGDTATDPILIQYWTIIIGFFLPLVISIIQRRGWTQQVQAMVAFGVAFAVTFIQLFLYGQLDNFVDPVASFLLVMVSTIAFYKGLWKPLGASPAIENNVNP